MWAPLLLVIGSYLLGSFPWLDFVGRLCGIDPRQEEDMHISLWRKAGPVVGALAIGGDFVRGVVPVVVGRALDFDLTPVALAGVAVVAGQMWPVFMKFDGEKGNSIGLTMAAALATVPFLIALVPIAAGALIRTIPRLTRRGQTAGERLTLGGPPSLSLPLGVAIGFGVLPLVSWGLGYPLEIVAALGALFLLIMVRRATAGLREELRGATDTRSVVINRLLFDRGRR